MSTAIKEAQQQRELVMAQGGIQANQAGSGFQMSGSALDIMRDSASQGALAHAVLSQQGLITEAGYNEQATSYEMMSQAAQQAGFAEQNAGTFADVMAGINVVAGIATAGSSDAIADLLPDSVNEAIQDLGD